MKFPNNTDAWAFHLGCLATCADQRDFEAMRAWEAGKTYIRAGNGYGYPPAAIPGVIADVRKRLTLAKAGVAEYP